MSDEQRAALNGLSERAATLKEDWLDYWISYSNMSTWQFWVNLAFFVVPLTALFLFLDRSKAFRIGFFGYGVHLFTGFLDAFGTTNGYWEYPFKWFPFLTNSIGLDASLIPVAYMFIYQWTLNHRKNYYLYMIALSAVFAFGIKPLLDGLDLFQRFRGLAFWHIFIVYLLLGTIPKWLTDFFAWYQHKARRPARA